MNSELKSEKEVGFVVSRSAEEISERREQLLKLREQFSIRNYYGGVGRTRSPEHQLEFDKLTARANELKWLLGEDVEIM